MKLYSYYISLDHIKNMGAHDFIMSECEIKNNMCLYAYTTKKKYAKEFEKYRDMDKFIKVINDISKEDLNDFECTFIYHKIELYEITTRKYDGNGIDALILPIIELEHSHCEDTCEFIEDFFVDCYSTIKSMKYLLKSINNKKICKKIGSKIYYKIMDLSIKSFHDVIMDEPINPDFLFVFLSEFGNLLKIKE